MGSGFRHAVGLFRHPLIAPADLEEAIPPALAARFQHRLVDLGGDDLCLAEQLEIDAKYAVYLNRQAQDVESYRRDESFELPDALDYAAITGLSNEVRHKLQTARPRTIGHAGKIDGMTPAALTLLVAHVRRKGRARPEGRPAA